MNFPFMTTLITNKKGLVNYILPYLHLSYAEILSTTFSTTSLYLLTYKSAFSEPKHCPSFYVSSNAAALYEPVTVSTSAIKIYFSPCLRP